MSTIETIGPLSTRDRQYVLETTIALAQCQGKCVALITEWAHKRLHGQRGIDESKVLISRPDTLRQAQEIAECLVRSGACVLVVIDGFDRVFGAYPSYTAKIESICEKTNCDVVHLPHP